MPRFILIDPWVSQVGGHNFQYALDMLATAESSGYRPVLAIHKSLPDALGIPHEWMVLKLFEYGVCTRHWLGPDGRARRPCDLEGAWLLPSESLLPGHRQSLIQRVKDLLARCRDRSRRLDRGRRIRDFADGCSQLITLLNPTPDDVLFLPSLSEFDFLGLVRFLRDDPRSVAFTWHLQFHFNIFFGRDPEFAHQTDRLLRFQQQFESAVRQIPNHTLRFYATTEAIARQYEHIGVGRFQPLPYPVSPTIREGTSPEGDTGEGDTWEGEAPAEPLRSRDRETPAEPLRRKPPLRVTFAGGMRREKGRKKFGSLIASLWPDCLANGRMQFIFQAPPRQVTGWLPRQLRRQIAVAPLDSEASSAPLRTVQHPLPADAYARLIRETDLGLFLYDTGRYFARASGILCEMLTAGVPVVVPAGCWLGDQITDQAYHHVAALCRRSKFVLEQHELTLVQAPDGACTKYDVPEAASDLAIELDWPAEMPPGTYIELTMEPADDDNITKTGRLQPVVLGPPTQVGAGSILPRISPSASVRLRLRDAYRGVSLPITSIRVTALRPPAGQAHHPRSRVGLIAADEDQFTELIREALTHYQHYRRTAREFASLWLAKHHPGRTIECLAESNRSHVRHKPSSAA